MSQRPNFLLFMPETLRADAVFGDPQRRARTPNMDRLAEAGVSYTQCFAQSSYCSPSRISMFTGEYLHTKGHRSLMYLLQHGERNFFLDLKEAGYVNVAYGKNDLLSQAAIPTCFDETAVRVKPTDPQHRPNPWPKDDKWHKTFYHGRREKPDTHDHDWACVESALEFLDEDHEQPFCIYLPLSFAHPPYEVEEPFFSMHAPADMPAPIPVELAGKRAYVRIHHEGYGCSGLDEDDFRTIKACYFGMVSRVDYQLGLLVDKLKERGLYENTVIVMFSDHGDYAGDYGLVEKFMAGFEDCLLNVPLILRIPGVDGGVSADALCEMTDLYPTLMELAGLAPRHDQFGRSLLPLARGETAEHRDAVFASGGFALSEPQFMPTVGPGNPYYGMVQEYGGHPLLGRKAVMIRTRAHKYAYCPADRDELYDLNADPQTLRNIADEPESADLRNRLRERLMRWMLETGDGLPRKKDPRGWR